MQDGPRDLNVVTAGGNRADDVGGTEEARLWGNSQVTGVEGVADNSAGSIHEEELKASDPAEGGA